MTSTILNTEPAGIIEQTPWLAGFYQFEDESKTIRYFNCGLARYGGKFILAARRMKKLSMSPPRNSIRQFVLEGNAPVPGIGADIRIPSLAGENFEDPRLFMHEGEMMVSYCNLIGRSLAHQAIAPVNPFTFEAKSPIHVQHGGNASTIDGNSGPEKNWVWFSHDGAMHFVYSASPHEVCWVEDGKVAAVYRTPFKPKWNYGQIRGGTPPVKVGREYFTFFHSSVPWARGQRRYYMGAYAFKATAPFAVTRYTRQPLLVGSHNDQHCESAPPVVFPCGAVLDGKEWLVTGGSNDTKCFWIKIPHEELLERME